MDIINETNKNLTKSDCFEKAVNIVKTMLGTVRRFPPRVVSSNKIGTACSTLYDVIVHYVQNSQLTRGP